MKRTYKITGILVVLSLVIGGTVIYASGTPFGKARFFGARFAGRDMMVPGMMLSQVKEELELTDEQAAQVQALFDEFKAKGRESFQQKRGDFRQQRESLMKHRQEVWQELETQLKGILTEEQVQTLQNLRDKRAQAAQEFRQGMMNRAKEAKDLWATLDLTDTQKEEIFSIVGNYRDTHGNLLENIGATHTELLDTILANGFDEAHVRQLYQEHAAQQEEFFVAHAKMLAEIKAILNPEQITVLQERGITLLNALQTQLREHRSMRNSWFRSATE